jgi:hypothetical protein
MGPGIKLNDMPEPKDNSSEEFMVPRGKVVKRSDYTVTYTAM